MAEFTVTGPDGKTYDVTAPDGTSKAEVLARVKAEAERGAGPTTNALGQWWKANVGGPAAARVRDVAGDPYGARDEILAPTDRDRKAGAFVGRMVPETLTGAGALAGGLATGGMGYLMSILGPAAGAVVGGLAEGNKDTALDAAIAGAGGAAGKGVGDLIGWLARVSPMGKARIAEQTGRGVLGVANDVNPALGGAIESTRAGIKPTLAGARTPAMLQQGALGREGEQAIQRSFGDDLLQAGLGSPGARIDSEPLHLMWDYLPGATAINATTKNALKPDSAGTFTLGQAQEIMSRFRQAQQAPMLDRTVSQGESAGLIARAIEDVKGALTPQSAAIYGPARQSYAGGEALLEGLRSPGAFAGRPNRIEVNTPQIAEWMSQNRAELEARLGSDGFALLKDAILRGGQLGTKDILTPGTGEMSAALRQVYGRGQGGAPQIIGSAARTFLPNLGYQPTGRAPYSPTSQVDALLKMLGIQTGEEMGQR